jgi:hypothetical protein
LLVLLGAQIFFHVSDVRILTSYQWKQETSYVWIYFTGIFFDFTQYNGDASTDIGSYSRESYTLLSALTFVFTFPSFIPPLTTVHCSNHTDPQYVSLSIKRNYKLYLHNSQMKTPFQFAVWDLMLSQHHVYTLGYDTVSICSCFRVQ